MSKDSKIIKLFDEIKLTTNPINKVKLFLDLIYASLSKKYKHRYHIFNTAALLTALGCSAFIVGIIVGFITLLAVFTVSAAIISFSIAGGGGVLAAISALVARQALSGLYIKDVLSSEALDELEKFIAEHPILNCQINFNRDMSVNATFDWLYNAVQILENEQHTCHLCHYAPCRCVQPVIQTTTQANTQANTQTMQNEQNGNKLINEQNGNKTNVSVVINFSDAKPSSPKIAKIEVKEDDVKKSEKIILVKNQSKNSQSFFNNNNNNASPKISLARSPVQQRARRNSM